jgi:hypothetical protein
MSKDALTACKVYAIQCSSVPAPRVLSEVCCTTEHHCYDCHTIRYTCTQQSSVAYSYTQQSSAAGNATKASATQEPSAVNKWDNGEESAVPTNSSAAVPPV